MQTKLPYTFEYEGFGPVTVPVGTRVTHKTAMGTDPNYHFVDEYEWIDINYPSIAKVLRHDAFYHGINVPKQFIEQG